MSRCTLHFQFQCPDLMRWLGSIWITAASSHKFGGLRTWAAVYHLSCLGAAYPIVFALDVRALYPISQGHQFLLRHLKTVCERRWEWPHGGGHMGVATWDASQKQYTPTTWPGLGLAWVVLKFLPVPSHVITAAMLNIEQR
jgi:hypothetical protein